MCESVCVFKMHVLLLSDTMCDICLRYVFPVIYTYSAYMFCLRYQNDFSKLKFKKVKVANHLTFLRKKKYKFIMCVCVYVRARAQWLVNYTRNGHTLTCLFNKFYLLMLTDIKMRTCFFALQQLDSSHFLFSPLVKLNGGRHVQGILRGFDPFMNLVMDDCLEMGPGGQQNTIGMVVSAGAGQHNTPIY